MLLRLLAPCAVLLTFCVACSAEAPEIQQVPQVIEVVSRMVPDTSGMALSNNTFALNLYKQLAAEKGNVFYSPYSIDSALTMTMAGAKNQTWGEMYCALSLPASRAIAPAGLPYASQWSDPFVHQIAGQLRDQIAKAAEHKDIALSIANNIYPANDFVMKDEFVSTLKQSYGVAVTPVVYPEPGRQTINDWVQEQTQDRIKDLLKPSMVSGDTRLVLVNAIYFKGAWQRPFDPDATSDQAFHLAADQQVEVPMMYQKQRVAYAEDEACQLVELPYAGRKLSMVVLLPKAGQDLDKLMAELTAESWDKRIKQARHREVELHLPKFKLEYEQALNEPLKALGMKLAFTGEADFTLMAEGEDLFISLVQHKAFIEVNEAGSEAAAATAVAVMRTSASIEPQEVPVFRADRPFVYAIRDVESGTILFMGRLADPRG